MPTSFRSKVPRSIKYQQPNLSSMAPLPESLTYEDVMKAFREEKRSNTITEIRKDFYITARQLVEQLKRDHERESALDPYSAKARGLGQQINRLTEKTMQIFDFRAEKVTLMAIRAASGGKLDESRLTPEEKALLESVLQRTKASREAIFSSGERCREVIPAPTVAPMPVPMISKTEVQERSPAVQPEGEEAKLVSGVEGPSVHQPKIDMHKEGQRKIVPEPPSTPVPKPMNERPAETKGAEVLLRILEDVPSFAGPDSVYKLHKEDVITLPASIGRALIKRGKAEEITPGST